MPRYRITSPEGKSITVEGNRPPTEQDIAAIFGTVGTQAAPAVQPQEIAPVQPNNYSATEHLKYGARNLMEVPLFGMGNMVAGYTNTLANDLADVTHGKDLATRAKGYGKALFHSIVPSSAVLTDDFKQGRKDYIEEKEAYHNAHPVISNVEELIGGLFGGVAGAGKKVVASLAKPTLWNMAKSSAKTGFKEGGKIGAIYSGVSGATSDPDKLLNVKKGLIGTGTGAIGGSAIGGGLGFVTPYGIAGAVGTWNLGKKVVGKVADALRNKTINALQGANKELVEQAVREGKPLIDIADRQLLDVAESANMLNSKAKQTFADYGQQRIAGQHPKVINEMQQYFGNKGSHQLLEELQADVQKGSKVLYDRAVYQLDKEGNILLDNAGNPIGKVLPELEKLNKYELDYVGKVYGTKGLEYEVSGLPQNDMRILNYAKQLMDDDIQRLTNQGHNNQARILAEKRAAFIEKIDKANPEYKTARAFFERGKRAEDALQAGKKAISGERSNMEYDFNKLTPEEQAFYRKGVGNALEELSNQQASGGNIAHKMFGEETLRRLKQLGIKDMDKLEAFARAESKAASNINTLRGGSPTTPREEMIKRFLKRPTRMAKALAIETVFKPFAANPAEIAKAMTDPQYLANMYARANKGNTSKSVMQVLNNIGTQAGGTAAVEPSVKINDVIKSAKNTIKNEGGFIANPLSEGEGKISKVLSEKASQLKRDLKVLGYDDNVFYADAVHAPSKENLSKINTYKNIIDGKALTKGKLIDLGETPQKLLEGGVENHNLYINYDVISKAHGGKNAGHDLAKDVIKEVPEKLYNPIAVLNSRNKLGGSVVVTELKDKTGKPVIAAIRLDKTPQGMVINDIKSIHGRESFDELFGFSLDEGKLRKIDIKKMENIPSTYRAIIAQGSKHSPNHSIVNEAGKVKAQFLDIDGVKRPTTNSEGQPIAKNSFGVNNFWDAFKGSQVVNEQGKPLVVYHGTANEFNTFDKSKGQTPLFWFTADKKSLFDGRTSTNAKGGVKKVMEVYLDIKNPANSDQYENFTIDQLKARGFDGIKLTKKDGYSSDMYIAFEPNQIKSVNNIGTFSKKSDNIYKSIVGGLGISQILRNKENK